MKRLQRAIKDGDMHTVEQLVGERKNLALYRDAEGSSALHEAIENRHLDIAAFLLQRYPTLSQVKDVVSPHLLFFSTLLSLSRMIF